MDTLAQTVKLLRQKQNSSLQDLASDSGISKAHVWDIERGASKNPSVDTLCRLALALDAGAVVLLHAAMNDWFAEHPEKPKKKVVTRNVLPRKKRAISGQVAKLMEQAMGEKK